MKKCILKEILLDEGGISQTNLAITSGVSVNTVNKLANNQYVSQNSIAKVTKGLNDIIGTTKYTRDSLFINIEEQ